MSVALEFDHVSKIYESHFYRTLRDGLAHVGAALVRRPRPRPEAERALDDITFSVPVGESVAIIGRNGAGKTTALKLATRIAYPTSGRIRVRGRVSALIEVGTGMHPELTGRENIQLFGRILGFTPKQIAARFDEIVDFAAVGDALDYPVKYFSSGMQLRLGFSLAAHLEPDVLMVDEAIAVGDAGFQYRCVERMRQIVRSGRTLVFVSHDMGAVETLCDRAILLDKGRVRADGPAREVVRRYLEGIEAERTADTRREEHHGPLEIPKITLHDAQGRELSRITPDQPLIVRLHYTASEPVDGPIFSVGLGAGGLGCFSTASMLTDGAAPERLSGAGTVDCRFESLPLNPGTYEVWVSVRGQAGFGDIVDWGPRRLFQVVDDDTSGAIAWSSAEAPIRFPYRWSIDGVAAPATVEGQADPSSNSGDGERP
jgi:homopolymeric O-antigen transport system ATP-binding protein